MGLPAQRPRYVSKREAEGRAVSAELAAEGVSEAEFREAGHALMFLALSNSLSPERLGEVLTRLPHLAQ